MTTASPESIATLREKCNARLEFWQEEARCARSKKPFHGLLVSMGQSAYRTFLMELHRPTMSQTAIDGLAVRVANLERGKPSPLHRAARIQYKALRQ